jgi:hypothetical protein
MHAPDMKSTVCGMCNPPAIVRFAFIASSQGDALPILRGQKEAGCGPRETP